MLYGSSSDTVLECFLDGYVNDILLMSAKR